MKDRMQGRDLREKGGERDSGPRQRNKGKDEGGEQRKIECKGGLERERGRANERENEIGESISILKRVSRK